MNIRRQRRYAKHWVWMSDEQWGKARRICGGGHSEGIRRAIDYYGGPFTAGVSRVRGGETAGVVSACGGESGRERAAELEVSGVRAADEGEGSGGEEGEDGGGEGESGGD